MAASFAHAICEQAMREGKAMFRVQLDGRYVPDKKRNGRLEVVGVVHDESEASVVAALVAEILAREARA